LALKNSASTVRLSTLLEEEKQVQAAERQALLSQITALISSTAQKQEMRVQQGIASIRTEIDEHAVTHSKAHEVYVVGEQQWSKQSDELVGKVIRSRDNVKNKLKSDFAAANEHTNSIRIVTTSVHDSTVKTVQEQMTHLDAQLHGLDDIVERIKEQNNTHHAAHVSSLSNLATNVQTSYSSIGGHFTTSFSRVSELDADMSARTSSIQDTLPTLSEVGDIRQPLADLREAIESQALEEYRATGETPQRTTYDFPISLPRTEPHDTLLSKLRGRAASSPTGSPAKASRSPAKTLIFSDGIADNVSVSSSTTRPGTSNSTTSFSGLRELDVNAVIPTAAVHAPTETGDKLGALMPPLKRQNTSGNESKLPKKRSARMTVAGNPNAMVKDSQENVDLSRSVGAGSAMGRSLRSGRGS
jgi:kinesin family protein 11